MFQVFSFFPFSDKPVIITAPLESYTKTAGQTLSIPCQWNLSDANPTWSFMPPGSNMSSSSVVDQRKVEAKQLTLTAVATENEGKYVCSAANKYGDSQVSTKIVSVISEFFFILGEYCYTGYNILYY